jgi:hypothetical protein
MNVIKPTFKLSELEDNGFQLTDEAMLDGEDYYKTYSLSKNESELSVTHEFDAWGDPTNEIVEFNSTELKGTKPTWKDLKTLIEIM